MPIYEYRCSVCDLEFELIVRGFANDESDSQTKCPSCSNSQVVRLISQIALLNGGNVGIGRAAYPTAWDQTGGGNGETIKYWQSRVEREQKEEAKHPELVGIRHGLAESKWIADLPITAEKKKSIVNSASAKTGEALAPVLGGHSHGGIPASPSGSAGHSHGVKS